MRETRDALYIATGKAAVARKAAQDADDVKSQASTDYERAQNDLIVAAGGTDRSFIWNLGDNNLTPEAKQRLREGIIEYESLTPPQRHPDHIG